MIKTSHDRRCSTIPLAPDCGLPLSRDSAPQELRKVRKDLPIYIFSGSDDPVGQRLEGVRALVDRYRSAGITSITHDFYPGGRHEMLHELNRREVLTNLLVWISALLHG